MAKAIKPRYYAGQPLTVVLPSVRVRKATHPATILSRDPHDEEESYLCAVHLPSSDTQPERSITLPGGFALNQIEASTQLSLF